MVSKMNPKPTTLFVLAGNINPIVLRKIISEIKKYFNFKIKIKKQKTNKYFTKIFEGVYLDSRKICTNKLHRHRAIIFTNEELYFRGARTEDSWLFGSSWRRVAAVSTKRLATGNQKLFAARLINLVLHELAHWYLHSRKHLRQFMWCPRNKPAEKLGLHCPNKNCLFYEVVDIKPPSLKEGYVTMAGRKICAAGLDENIKKSRNKFCRACLEELSAHEV